MFSLLPHAEMTTSREALSDGVIAIIVTIMVWKVRAPAWPRWWGLLSRLRPSSSGCGLGFPDCGHDAGEITIA
jgi:hypothetical protein